MLIETGNEQERTYENLRKRKTAKLISILFKLGYIGRIYLLHPEFIVTGLIVYLGAEIFLVIAEFHY